MKKEIGGRKLSPEDRMKAILAKQAEADETKRAEEAAESIATDQAEAMRAEVTGIWDSKLKPALLKMIAEANESMPGGRKLFVQLNGPAHQSSLVVDEILFSFEDKAVSLLTKKCTVRILPDGIVVVSMESHYRRSAKGYNFEALTATEDRMKGIVLDYLEMEL
jgi:hypothetical protein